MNFHSILLVTMFLLSVAGNGQKGKIRVDLYDITQGQCIDSVIKQDSLLRHKRNLRCKEVAPSQAIREYAAGIDQINFTQCPALFATAFQQYKKAWLGMARVTDQYSKLRGELHEVLQEVANSKNAVEFRQQLQVLIDTWAEVEKAVQLKNRTN
jgi:hypothetical protein